jgi:hypothetical protein
MPSGVSPSMRGTPLEASAAELMRLGTAPAFVWMNAMRCGANCPELMSCQHLVQAGQSTGCVLARPDAPLL